eukprot:gnl/Hemi2/19335_TR6422_c0_g1_i2.p1 gnl/Hemi2/19335_TR6422_c0_g1~~gnl/Hemi2/19335_TR6422_c0_g1_i2.p1  ORF type:complete len:310 (-),score=60.68 gnl/Hemi2/19335_TR6422_c0_g1_i2:96-1025(-)
MPGSPASLVAAGSYGLSTTTVYVVIFLLVLINISLATTTSTTKPTQQPQQQQQQQHGKQKKEVSMMVNPVPDLSQEFGYHPVAAPQAQRSLHQRPRSSTPPKPGPDSLAARERTASEQQHLQIQRLEEEKQRRIAEMAMRRQLEAAEGGAQQHQQQQQQPQPDFQQTEQAEASADGQTSGDGSSDGSEGAYHNPNEVIIRARTNMVSNTSLIRPIPVGTTCRYVCGSSYFPEETPGGFTSRTALVCPDGDSRTTVTIISDDNLGACSPQEKAQANAELGCKDCCMAWMGAVADFPDGGLAGRVIRHYQR